MPWDVLTDEQRELRDLVRQLARERIAPRAAEIDASHEFPWDVVELFRANDIFGLFFAEEYGGLGTGALLSLIARRAMRRRMVRLLSDWFLGMLVARVGGGIRVSA